MKKFLLFLFALFLLTACGGDDPEPVSVRGALNGACYPNKTCNEGLDCSEENICVKIENGGENGNSDENSGSNPENSDDSDSSSGNEPSDGGDSVSDDENTDSGDSAPDSDSTGNGAECGNGTKEAGELCEKGEKLACSELDAQYPADKSATCNDYCNGWNTNECTGAATVPPRGTFPAVTFEIDYLYKGMDAFNAGENQDDEQYATGLFETSIALSDGSVFDIPHPQANVHWISAYYI